MRGGSIWAALVTLAVVACGMDSRQVGPPAEQPLLRVGVSPDAAPVAFMRDGRIVGIEPDLAQALVDRFRRPLALVPLDFDGLIPALLDGRVDVIMSGMTVTPARQVRVAFAEPYMESGLVAACARAALPKYKTRDDILSAPANVGVRMGTTAESWAEANMRYATVMTYPNIDFAAHELSQGRLDLIISDFPQVAWAISERAGNLQVVRMLLTDEEIAWAFRPQDSRLRDLANQALASWRRDGTLHAILQRWIPYLDAIREETESPPRRSR